MNSGSEMTLAVYVENLGNVVDRVGSVEVSDNCPLLTVGDGLDSLTNRDIASGSTINSPLLITASQSHPQRNCEVDVTVSSNGATNSGGSEFAEDNVRVMVEPPPVNEVDPGEDLGDDDGAIDEVVSSNLPNLSIFLTVFAILVSASLRTQRQD